MRRAGLWCGALLCASFVIAWAQLCETSLRASMESHDGPVEEDALVGRKLPGQPLRQQGDARDPDPPRVTQLREELRTSMSRYREGLGNIFFEKRTYVEDLLVNTPNLVGDLKNFLSDFSSLEMIDKKLNSLSNPLHAVLQRMAAIDVLEQVASLPQERASRDDARKALRGLVGRIPDTNLAPEVRRTLLAEQYEALEALVRVDPQAGFAAYVELKSEPLADLLSAALVAGLIDTGMSRQEAWQTVRSLRRAS